MFEFVEPKGIVGLNFVGFCGLKYLWIVDREWHRG